MVLEAKIKAPIIKLKVSLPANTSLSPLTPTSSKKGKERAIQQDETPTLPKLGKVTLRAPSALIDSPRSSGPVLKVKKPTGSPSVSAPATTAVPEAGPSRIRMTTPQPPREDSDETTTDMIRGQPMAAPVALAEPVLLPPLARKTRLKNTPVRKSKNTSISHKIISAIPPHILSVSTPPTPKPMLPPPLPITPHTPPATNASMEIATPVKVEPMDVNGEPDPLSLPMSPLPTGSETPGGSIPDEGDRGRPAVKWVRTKKPLRDLLGKIMVELRRKDEYALFDDPVDLDHFTDYLDIIGGEDKMMDLGTMQGKIDNGEYRSMDQFEVDLRILVTAAQTFNAPATIPYTSAGRILQHGLKLIERFRPTVRTPSPSPVRGTTSETGTPWRGRETTAADDENNYNDKRNIPPESYIPDEMLLFPPNSAQALAVGWNLTGGKRVYAKRFIRGRERFIGKWRHWDLDGSRDLAEVDDPQDLLYPLQTQVKGARVTDWKGLRKDGAWWEFEVGGPNLQPTLPPTAFPRPKRLRQRDLGTFEWGVYPEVEAEVAILGQRYRGDEPDEVLAEHLRPSIPRLPPGQTANFVNVYEERRGAGDWLREVCMGDLKGEAYVRSVERFVRGAIEGREKEGMEMVAEEGDGKVVLNGNSTKSNYGVLNGDGIESNGNGEQRHAHEGRPEDHRIRSEDHIELDEYVHTKWRGGLLNNLATSTVQQTLKDLHTLHEYLTNPDAYSNLNASDGKALFTKLQNLAKLAQQIYPRRAISHLTRPSNPLDIAALLSEPGDFLVSGVGGRKGVMEGVEWVGKEICRLANPPLPPPTPSMVKAQSIGNGDGDEKMNGHGNGVGEVNGSKENRVKGEADGEGGEEGESETKSWGKRTRSNSSQIKKKVKLDSTPQPQEAVVEEKEIDRETAMRNLRLELVALSKFYPLAALKKMDKAEAERLLPVNVRGLMSRPDS